MIAGLLGGFLFSGIGFIAFRYGRQQGAVKPVWIGLVLMVYPYLMPNNLALYAVGVLLVAALFVFRD